MDRLSRLGPSFGAAPYDYGITPADLRVEVDEGLRAITLTTTDNGDAVEILLGPPQALDLVLRLIGCLHRLGPRHNRRVRETARIGPKQMSAARLEAMAAA